MSHGDQVQDLPDNFDLVAASTSAPIAAMQHSTKPIYAFNFILKLLIPKMAKLS